MGGKLDDSHCVMGNNSARCLNCGSEYVINMPASIKMLVAIFKSFADEHATCKPSAAGRKRFEYTTHQEWKESWDTGASSLAIYQFMTLGPGMQTSVPHDPSDFARCYKLLKVAPPEWRSRLSDLAAAFPVWRPFVETWHQLEAFYEEESPSGRCPQLGAAIQRLNRPEPTRVPGAGKPQHQ